MKIFLGSTFFEPVFDSQRAGDISLNGNLYRPTGVGNAVGELEDVDNG